MNALFQFDAFLLSMAKKISRFTSTWLGLNNFDLAKISFVLIVLLGHFYIAMKGVVELKDILIDIPIGIVLLFTTFYFVHKIQSIKVDNNPPVVALRIGFTLGFVFRQVVTISKITFFKGIFITMEEVQNEIIFSLSVFLMAISMYFLSYHDDPPKETWLSKALEKAFRKCRPVRSPQS